MTQPENKEARKADKQANKQTEAVQPAGTSLQSSTVDGGQNAEGTTAQSQVYKRWCDTIRRATALGACVGAQVYVDAGTPGAVRRESLSPLRCRNRDEVAQGMEMLEQCQLSCRHGVSSGGC